MPRPGHMTCSASEVNKNNKRVNNEKKPKSCDTKVDKSPKSDDKENEPELECDYCDRKFNVRTILIHLKLRIFLTISKILFTL